MTKSAGEIRTRAQAAGSADATPAPALAPRQFGRNLLVNVASLLTSMASGFFLAPFLIRRLGVAGYGLAPLIASVLSYLSVVNIALNSAVARHLSVAVSVQDRETASRVFNTSFWGSIALSTVIVGGGLLASSVASSLIVVPAGFKVDAAVLFMTTAGSVAMTLISSPLSAAIYYSNRLDLKGMVDLGNRLTYLVLVIVLISFVAARPAMVGVASLAGASFGLVQIASWSRRSIPWLRVRKVFDWRILREMAWFGGWSVLAYAGNMIFLTADLIIVNRMVGPTEGGVYAAMMQWPGIVRAFAATVAIVFSQPMAYIFGSKGSSDLYDYSMGAMRKTAVLAVTAAVTIGGSAEALIRLWLGPELGRQWPLLLVLVGHLGFNLAASPLITALQTLLKVRALGLMTVAAGVVSVVVAGVLVKTTGLEVWAVAGTSGVTFTLLSTLLIPLHASRVFGRRVAEPLRILGRAAGVTVAGIVAGNVVTATVHVSGWAALALLAGGLALASGASGIFAILEREERQFLVAAASTRVAGALAKVRAFRER